MRAPNISERNRYYISRHRYYELSHFCRQYESWKTMYAALLRTYPTVKSGEYVKEGNKAADITAKLAVARAKYSRLIQLVESAAEEADPVIGPYILKGVTTGRSYDELQAMERVPCCKNDYYKLRQKFFYILDKSRD